MLANCEIIDLILGQFALGSIIVYLDSEPTGKNSLVNVPNSKPKTKPIILSVDETEEDTLDQPSF